MIKRTIDVLGCLLLIGVAALPMIIIGFLICIDSSGPIIHWSSRVGIDNGLFRMPKFRTMLIETPNVATHLLDDPDQFVTRLGRILRKLSLDELPQMFSVLKGDMSLVGPRPALFNQDDLIALRTKQGVHRLPPGITGWAQVNGRDDLPIPQKVRYDAFYMQNQSVAFDLKIILKTVLNVFKHEGVNH
ncbi:MAG: sugar transferase [Desulfobacterales bacterium]|nr:sugar transferase [Desulfobacterales bacterium]